MEARNWVLIGGSDAGFLGWLEQILREDGYRVAAVAEEDAVLALSARLQPAAILLTASPAGMDALEVLRQVHTNPATQRVPVILVGEVESVEERSRWFAAGGAGFLSRPFPREELAVCVRMHIQTAVLERELAELREIQWQSDTPGAELRDNKSSFLRVADWAPMMVCASGPDRAATFFNRAWLEFTGRSLQQELGNGWLEAVHPDDREQCFRSYSEAFEARRTCYLEYRLRRFDGEYRWILCGGLPQFSAGGEFRGYVASCVDITDTRREQEEQYDRQRLESLRLLTGGIAHDFNNLLGAILVETELAEAEAAEGLPLLEAITRIRTAATHAAEIVRELMIYSGQDSATLEPLDVSRMVEDMLELLKVSISKHAQLRTELARNLPPVLGNATQIRQILMNLIINASEAIGDRAGEIYIATSKVTRHDDSDRSPAFDMPEGQYVRLTVADTGCGMSEAAKARIFEPFFTTKVNGHGLGLALVQGIVRSHGGGIKVESNRESGTTFEVLLPCASEMMVGNAPRSGVGLVGEIAPACTTVLLVEDEDMLRMAVTKALTRRGYRVLPASNGDAAVEIFEAQAETIGVVILDLTLPGMAGQEVLRRVRRIRPRVPVILTSAYDRWGDGRNPTPEEHVAFLKKPYRIGALVRVLMGAAAGAGIDSAYVAGHESRG